MSAESQDGESMAVSNGDCPPRPKPALTQYSIEDVPSLPGHALVPSSLSSGAMSSKADGDALDRSPNGKLSVPGSSAGVAKKSEPDPPAIEFISISMADPGGSGCGTHCCCGC
jgi:hypothetical protein